MKTIYYEFDIEMFDLEYGDIQDHEHFLSFEKGKCCDKNYKYNIKDFKKLYCTDTVVWNTVGSEFTQGLQKSCGYVDNNMGFRFCIVKNESSDWSDHRSWAYLNLDGTLPEEFDCGSKIPKYLIKAFEKLKAN